MEREEIIVLEKGSDEPIGPDWAGCCTMLYLPFRG